MMPLILNSPLVDITDTQFPNAYIKSIAVDPTNSDKVMIAFSNYQVYSIWYTEDGGMNWEKAAGNLEQFSSGTGNGPSVRAVSILPMQNGKCMYFAGTSTGLFMTDTIQGTNTSWLQISPTDIATNIVTDIKTRQADNLLVVSTHGNGIYSGTYDPTLVGIDDNSTSEHSINLYPNPTKDVINIELKEDLGRNVQIALFDNMGRIINRQSNVAFNANNLIQIDFSQYSSGLYYLQLSSGKKSLTAAVIKN